MAFTTLSYVCLVAIFGTALGNSSGDLGSCGRFEYEYRVLQDLLYLKMNQTNLETLLQQQQTITASLTTQLQDSKSTVNNLQNVVRSLERRRASSQSTYVRWGRTGCPFNDTDLVYSGYAAGSHYTHKGGAAEYLCLPQDPQWGHYESSAQGGGLNYGVEYEYYYRAKHQDFFKTGTGTSLRNHVAPCAVCMTSTKTTSLMIPGRNTCYDGWKVEYSGYLSSGHYNYVAASEYICVDESPEITNGSSTRDQNGKLLYFVEVRCGSLSCPPYVNYRELTCVVCSIDSRLVSP